MALSLNAIIEAPTSSSTMTNYQYPFAAAPDIVRSNQKDTYFKGVLLESLSNILRKLYGARFSHKYISEASTLAELLYLGCTTLIGNRTLGEEYCDIIQVEDGSLRLPTIFLRASYVLLTVLLPYMLARTLPAFRDRIRRILEARLTNSSANRANEPSYFRRLQSYILTNLSIMTSLEPVYALSLAAFYFSGAYYHIGKRILHLRYIFTKRLKPSEQRFGYELLGVLLALQMVVQGWVHLQSTMREMPPSLANRQRLAGGGAIIDGGVEVSHDPHYHYNNNNDLLFESISPSYIVSKDSIERNTHTPILQKPRYLLIDSEAMGWIEGRQRRKCTLCLDEFKDPTATTCGHVFCWLCITDWIKEKPECPLCRQGILSQHVLPLRG